MIILIHKKNMNGFAYKVYKWVLELVRGYVIMLNILASFWVNKSRGGVKAEDDLVNESTDVASIGTTHPHAPVQRQRPAEGGAPRFARVPHF